MGSSVAVAALRYFGRCSAPGGCKRRSVIEAGVTPGVEFVLGNVCYVAVDGRRAPVHTGALGQTALARELGLACPDHDRAFDFKRLVGRHRADKTCDGRCRMATGPDCECECGGEQHGRDRA